MRFINHTNSSFTIYNSFNHFIHLQPGEISQSFMGSVKMVYQLTKMGSTSEVAIVREGVPDDKVLSQCQFASRYVYNSVDDALSNLTVFNHSESSSIGVTGESLNKVTELTEKVKELEDIINNKDIIISNLNKNIDTLNEDKVEFQSKIERLNKEYQGYKSQVTTQINEMNSKLETQNEQVKSQQTTINNLMSEKISLESELNDIKSQLNSADEELSKISTLTDENDKLKTEINEKEKSLIEAKEIIEKITNEMEGSKSIWNKVCQQFGITFENGEWHCSYKGE